MKDSLKKLNSALLDLPTIEARYTVETELESLKLLSDLILSSEDSSELGK